MEETWKDIFNNIDKLNIKFITMVVYGKIPKDEIETAIEEYVNRLTYADLVNPFLKSNLESDLKRGGYDYLFLGEVLNKARTEAGIGVVEERGYKVDSEKKRNSVEK